MCGTIVPLEINATDYKDLFKLVGFSDRESSIFSDYSDDWRDERVHKVALGLSSATSEVGDEGLDQWEWEDECYFNQEETQQETDDVWLPDPQQLLWEKELELTDSRIYSDRVSSKSSLPEDDKFVCRLPPSGRSSVQSLHEKARSEEAELKSYSSNSKLIDI